MKYALSRQQERLRNKAYCVYVTDTLNFVAENTARYAGGKSFQHRYADIYKPVVVETRTAEEIIGGIRDKLKVLEETE